MRNEGEDDSSSSRARHQPDGSRIRLDEFHGPDCDHAQSGVARLGHLDDSAGNESGLLEADQTLRVGVGEYALGPSGGLVADPEMDELRHGRHKPDGQVPVRTVQAWANAARRLS